MPSALRGPYIPPTPPPSDSVHGLFRRDHASFDGRYLLGSSNAVTPEEGTFFHQDLVDPVAVPYHLVHLARDVPSSGHVVQERAFLQAFGSEIASDSFIGHIDIDYRSS